METQIHRRTIKTAASAAAAVAVMIVLCLTVRYNFLLFHSFAELTSIGVAAAMFSVAWHSRRFSANGYLTYLGISFVFVACLDLIHTLSYKGMGVFTGYGANLPTQLWIAARGVQSLSLLISPIFLIRQVRPWPTFLIYLAATAVILALIFPLNLFPVCYIESGPHQGLTPFKIVAEYVICLVLLAGMVFLWVNRRRFSTYVLTFIMSAIGTTILSELAFTRYVGVYGDFNIVGHLLKFASFLLFYKAIVQASLKDPYQGLFRDLKQQEEALRESEKEYRLLFASNPNPMFVFDEETLRFLAVNEAAISHYGWSREELLTMSVLEIRPPEDRAWARDVIKQHRGTPETRVGVRRHWRKDGTTMDMEITVSPIHFAGREARLCSAKDITDRKRAEEALQKAYDSLELRVKERTAELQRAYEALQHEVEERRTAEEQLRQSQKMEAVGTLAGGIAHDFNNILASIIGFTEMAAEDVTDRPEVERSLQNVLKSAMRARELVKQILTFSRKATYERSPLRLSPLIKETVQLLRASIPTTVAINLTISATSDTILAAPVEIQQILMNLATNASLAMQETGGTLEISLADIELTTDSPVLESNKMPGEYLQLAVKDTGIGMSPDVVKRVFEPFFTTREVGKGTGMGLAVVYGIVKDLQGIITVESDPGKGSIFRVLLPKLTTDARTETPHAVEIPGGKERILFIDDEEMLVEWGQVTLERLGYRVTAVSDGIEALKIFSADPSLFDLVITDQAMPKTAGSQLSTELLRIRSDIPIILCTGHSETISQEKTKTIGIREFLIKPLTKQELATAIRRVLDTKQF